MTLRGRLTTAFLAVVLGPVLLGALFVGGTVVAVGSDLARHRLDLAATAVRTSVGALCRQLQASADAIAVLSDDQRRASAAELVVSRGLASGVQVTDGTGAPVLTSAAAPALPWADCAAAEAGARTSMDFAALAARVEMHDAAGVALGAVYAVQTLDDAFIERLAAATGSGVTLLDSTGPLRSSEPAAARASVAVAAGGLVGDSTGQTEDGRYVRRVGPGPDQPLPLAVSVARTDPRPLYTVLALVVLLSGVCAVLVAWWLARSTTRPLAELARAADRVAGGDLEARVPVRGGDEVARLGGTFNRMTREMQSYVQAVTSSRDQLRRHLSILGDTLSSTHDLDRILEVILQTALVATGARAGVVLLREPSSGALVGRCANGLRERWPTAGPGVGAGDPAALRVPVGRGVLGGVAASGEPRRGRVNSAGEPLAAEEPRCLTFVAVPFCSPNPAPGDIPAPGALAPLGVLALYDRLGADEFDDADLVTLRTFAGHAAVAVDNVRMHHEAQRLSLTDPLTGLWNYRHLKDSIRREVERASRFRRMMTVLALDLDRFKRVNDNHGHAAGDAVLIEFANRVRAALREVDLAFRQGGEEFMVLLPETDASGGAIVAERLGAAIRDAAVVIEDQTRIPVTVSIGVAVYPDHGTTAQQVIDAADTALYAAKAAGRDTYRIAAPATSTRTHDGVSVPVAAVVAAVDAATVDDSGAEVGPAHGAPNGPQPPRQTRGR